MAALDAPDMFRIDLLFPLVALSNAGAASDTGSGLHRSGS